MKSQPCWKFEADFFFLFDYTDRHLLTKTTTVKLIDNAGLLERLFTSWGFDYVVPVIIYLVSLLLLAPVIKLYENWQHSTVTDKVTQPSKSAIKSYVTNVVSQFKNFLDKFSENFEDFSVSNSHKRVEMLLQSFVPRYQ